MSAEAAMDASTEDNDFNNEPRASGSGVESDGVRSFGSRGSK